MRANECHGEEDVATAARSTVCILASPMPAQRKSQ